MRCSFIAWGASGRWFKSSRPDHLKAVDSPPETGGGSAAFDLPDPDARPTGAPLAELDADFEANAWALDARFARAEGDP